MFSAESEMFRNVHHWISYDQRCQNWSRLVQLWTSLKTQKSLNQRWKWLNIYDSSTRDDFQIVHYLNEQGQCGVCCIGYDNSCVKPTACYSNVKFWSCVWLVDFLRVTCSPIQVSNCFNFLGFVPDNKCVLARAVFFEGFDCRIFVIFLFLSESKAVLGAADS